LKNEENMSNSMRHRVLGMNEEQLRQLIVEHGNDPTGLMAQTALQDKRAEKVSRQLEQLSEVALRPIWKTVMFWIVLATFFVASAAFLRDVVGWTVFGFDSPAPNYEPQGLTPSERSGQQSSTIDPSPSSTHQSADPPP
jgi:hypothetical protein